MKQKEPQRPFIEKITNDNREYVQSLLDENHRLNTQLASLKDRLTAIEEESRDFSARYVEVEQQNTNLANLYVASYQLHGTLDRDASRRCTRPFSQSRTTHARSARNSTIIWSGV